MESKHIPHSGKSHQIRLSPELTALIIVDHQVAFESCFNRKALKAAENGAANLLGAIAQVTAHWLAYSG